MSSRSSCGGKITAVTAAETSPRSASALLDDQTLERSAVVANNAMNRERGLTGVNSYSKDLAFDPLAYLRECLAMIGTASWLDLCCGTGRALIQTARQQFDGLHLTGVDLVDYFEDHSDLPTLDLITASVSQWQPHRRFDLITCVHGLHYVGDKLGLISRALAWLTPGGTFVAHLDLANVKIDGDPRLIRLKSKFLANDLQYDARRRILTCRSSKEVDFGYRYHGADDTAGPNYTGQPAVTSHYKSIDA